MNTQQEATKFEVKIRIYEKEAFRPGMSATAEVETRSRSNVLTVPIQSVTMRLPKELEEEKRKKEKEKKSDSAEAEPEKKGKPGAKAEEVVFEIRNGTAHRLKVKRGISDNDYVEILSGVAEGQEIVSGSYKVINRELEEGKRVKVENRVKTL
jgi:HlyD family secretion protein